MRKLMIFALPFGAGVLLGVCLLPAALPEGLRYACGGLGFLLGLAGAAACDRRVRRGRTISYQITRKL